MMEEMHHKGLGGHSKKSLKVVFIMLGILRIHLLTLRVSLVSLFRQLFKQIMEVSLVYVFPLLREVVSIQGVHFLGGHFGSVEPIGSSSSYGLCYSYGGCGHYS